jgi:hypothetical protein
MKISFSLDRSRYPVATADRPWVALSSMLESDLQGDFSIDDTLDDLRKALAAGSRINITGNAHTIAVAGADSTVLCNDDPSIPTSRIPTKDLIDLVLAWKSFRSRGTPKEWPTGGSADTDAVQPPQ